MEKSDNHITICCCCCYLEEPVRKRKHHFMFRSKSSDKSKEARG